MNNVHIKHGSEGPRHDPYAYTEVTIDCRQGKVTYHGGGLLEWCVWHRNGPVQADGADAMTLFEKVVGFRPDQIERFHYNSRLNRIRTHLKKCHGEIETAAGMPGETMYTCSVCHEVLHCDFNRSAIE